MAEIVDVRNDYLLLLEALQPYFSLAEYGGKAIQLIHKGFMEAFQNGMAARSIGNDLSSISLDVLRAELLRRDDTNLAKPACGSRHNRGSYNVSVHVFALFLILILSTLACSFPIIARRFPNLPIPHRFLFLSRHFGTGVLIATAFIHLLPTAFISMTDPCLPRFWNKTYPPMPGLIAMVAMLAVVGIEQFFAIRGAKHSHASEFAGLPTDEDEDHLHTLRGGYESHANGHLPLHNVGHTTIDTPTMDSPMPTGERKRSQDDGSESDDDDAAADLDALDPIADESAYLSRPSQRKLSRNNSIGHDSQAAVVDNPQKAFLQCLLLEAGILFHSIFIGMAVSVATGTEFGVLLVAICFHQTFEGFALGARIANLIPALFDATSPKPWLMALAYGATTPIGQALGLWLHELYDPNSEVGLLTVGITNAVSSGLLLFAGLVQLVAEDFLADKSYSILKGRRRLEANLAVACGAFLMAMVGAFA